MSFLKSPMNYIGNKYRLLNQIIPLLPPAKCFVDLFAGGLDVSINYDAEIVYCNDINHYLIDIYKAFQNTNNTDLIKYIDNRIEEFSLSKTDKDSYMKFRYFYNNSDKNPLDLYVLMNYGFNYQLRFNSIHDFNNPFGKNRSSFNSAIRKRLLPFSESIKNYNFTSCDFRAFDYSVLNKGDLIYCDPPYRISTGSYNDGKRGFNGWSEDDDLDLIAILDKLSERDVHFALSNVLKHKGLKNDILIEWSKKYKVYDLNSNYKNCNYQTINKNSKTMEVLITNG